jgi:FG-GAP-like repeat
MNLSGVFRLRGTFYYPVITLLCLLVGNVHLWAQFETRATDPFPEGGSSIATGDFNHDGNLDVVMIAGVGFSVALGNGDGTFSRPVNYRANVPFSLAVADFNNDGNLDIVVADSIVQLQ